MDEIERQRCEEDKRQMVEQIGTAADFQARLQPAATDPDQQEQPAHRKRCFIKVFVDPETRQALKTKAREQAGLSASAYLLKCGLEQKIKPPLPVQVVKDINGFGRLFNQVAHASNASDVLNMEKIEELKQRAQTIIKLLRKEK
jgi:hypothetical protein